jgi:hypothetical protein
MPDPATMQARQPILAPGRGLSLQALAHAGATLTGRLVAVDDRRVIFTAVHGPISPRATPSPLASPR